MYIHRITFAAPDISTMVTLDYRCKETVMPSGKYEEMLLNLWEELKKRYGKDVKQPVLIGYIKTKE